MLDFQKLSATYQQALLRQVVPFWLKNGRDEQCGGYFDSLSVTGAVIDGDKSVKQQAQQVWALAWLYNTLDGQPAWLDHARHGAAFLSRFAHNDSPNCYAWLDRRGRPVATAADVTPDCLVVMAYAQLHRATGEDEWQRLAKQIFSNVCLRQEAIRIEHAAIGGLRQAQHLSQSTALLKTVLEMQPLLDEETWKQNVDKVLHEIRHEFVDRRLDILREYVLPEGAFVNTPEGRRLNVGLTCQTVSYLLDLCAGSGNRKLATQAVGWCLRVCDQAWDESAGGLNQYVDLKNQPLLFPEWQQKWAWVQVEASTALIKGHFYTRHPDCARWFKRIHDYTFQYFPDVNQTGWHIALDSYHQPLLAAKATPSVGCFSLIRCLTETAQILVRGESL